MSAKLIHSEYRLSFKPEGVMHRKLHEGILNDARTMHITQKCSPSSDERAYIPPAVVEGTCDATVGRICSVAD
jgi:hypothetical protein